MALPTFPADFALLAKLGTDAYRFSVSGPGCSPPAGRNKRRGAGLL